MGNFKIIELINGHLADLEKGNIENLCRDWVNSYRSLITLFNKQVQGYENICMFYQHLIDNYSSRSLRLTDFRIDCLSEMACIHVTYVFKGIKNQKIIEKSGKGEIVLQSDDSIHWQLCNVRFR